MHFDSVPHLATYLGCAPEDLDTLAVGDQVSSDRLAWWTITELASARPITIGAHSFSGCAALATFRLPAGTTSLGDGAFHGCTGITKLRLNAGLAHIGTEAFANCSGLPAVRVPGTVWCIGERAFAGCAQLTVLHLSVGLRAIRLGAFAGCTGLADVLLPDGTSSTQAVCYNAGWMMILIPVTRLHVCCTPEGGACR